jgi:hypothetical protein
MPRFFFDSIEDENAIRDVDGVFMESLEKAEIQAAMALAETMLEQLSAVGSPSECEVVIRDQNLGALSRLSLKLVRERMG